MHINSPGGTVAGSEQLYDSLMQLKAKKPMVVVVDGLAASGGYIAAMASDHIVAQQSSLVGSIGVLFQYPNVTELLKTIGVKVEEVKSSPLKAAPNGFEPTSPEARAAHRGDRDGFLCLVPRHGARPPQARRRRARAVADGRVFTGRQALELKLIDELGDEQTAIDWLAKEKNIDPKTPVRDYRLQPRFGDLPFLHVAAVGLLDARRPDLAGRAAARTGARSRRSSGSTLTVYWRFGTLRQPIDAAGVFGSAAGAAADDQVRTGAAHLRGQPASLSARRREHRQRHPRRDHRRAWRAATGSNCAASARSR